MACNCDCSLERKWRSRSWSLNENFPLSPMSFYMVPFCRSCGIKPSPTGSGSCSEVGPPSWDCHQEDSSSARCQADIPWPWDYQQVIISRVQYPLGICQERHSQSYVKSFKELELNLEFSLEPVQLAKHQLDMCSMRSSHRDPHHCILDQLLFPGQLQAKSYIKANYKNPVWWWLLCRSQKLDRKTARCQNWCR